MPYGRSWDESASRSEVIPPAVTISPHSAVIPVNRRIDSLTGERDVCDRIGEAIAVTQHFFTSVPDPTNAQLVLHES
jgi:hypothetical protein